MKPVRVTVKIEFESTLSGETATASYTEICYDTPKALNNAFNGTNLLSNLLRSMCQSIKDVVVPAMEQGWRDRQR